MVSLVHETVLNEDQSVKELGLFSGAAGVLGKRNKPRQLDINSLNARRPSRKGARAAAVNIARDSMPQQSQPGRAAGSYQAEEAVSECMMDVGDATS